MASGSASATGAGVVQSSVRVRRRTLAVVEITRKVACCKLQVSLSYTCTHRQSWASIDGLLIITVCGTDGPVGVNAKLRPPNLLYLRSRASERNFRNPVL